MTADAVTKFISVPMMSQDATTFWFCGLKYLARGAQRAKVMDVMMEALRDGDTPAIVVETALLAIGARKL